MGEKWATEHSANGFRREPVRQDASDVEIPRKKALDKPVMTLLRYVHAVE